MVRHPRPPADYAERIAELKANGAELVVIFGIGRVCHIAFWEPHFAGRVRRRRRLEGARRTASAPGCIPLTIEQNALTSFKSRTTLVPAFANTIGPGLFLQADRIIGGADGIFGRGMQWQGASLWMTLRYGPDPGSPAPSCRPCPAGCSTSKNWPGRWSRR